MPTLHNASASVLASALDEVERLRKLAEALALAPKAAAHADEVLGFYRPSFVEEAVRAIVRGTSINSWEQAVLDYVARECECGRG